MEGILNWKMDESDDFYKLLGCNELSTTEQINVEFKVRARDVHPDKNSDNPDAAQQFAKLQRAREVLLDTKLRQEYDYWRCSGVALPYDSWIAMKDTMHMSMHWAVRTKKDLMLEGETETPDSPGTTKMDAPERIYTVPSQSSQGQSRVFRPAGWSRETNNDILQKFRNYDI